MSIYHQSSLFSAKTRSNNNLGDLYPQRLLTLLSEDLDFHGQDSSYGSHSFHSFPAKFPPQLPRKFIFALTEPGEIILDPMMGSGTTILEAVAAHRQGLGFDIDPLAHLITTTKVTKLDVSKTLKQGNSILTQARQAITTQQPQLAEQLQARWDDKTQKFIDYWFAYETQLELLALILEIEKIEDAPLKAFFELTFSAIIITKSGGVSLALDLAHTRPHRAKIALARTGEFILGQNLANDSTPRLKFLTKTLRSPLEEFEKRLRKNIDGLKQIQPIDENQPQIRYGNTQNLPLDEAAVDLIITSPPYASNAIDYMRAHKFSLVWLGYPIDDLGEKRRKYIGGEALTGFEFETMPTQTAQLIADIASVDPKKGRVLHRYYSEMKRSLQEMFRVLKPGKAAILVVGSSIMRGKDTETAACLADIGREIGFEVPKIGVRQLDRDRRMLPAGTKINTNSQIQQRMHEEHVIGFYRPVD